MPEVLNNTQTKAVFMPDAHLPTMPRHVDTVERYQATKRKWGNSNLSFLGMQQGTQDSQNAMGDLIEKELFKELKVFYMNSKVVVF